jgi:hypothetical protein
MTISSTTVKNSYSGDGSTDQFNYTFKIFADSDLQVIIRSAAGTETVKTITTHYTVAGAGNTNGGSITFTSGNIPTATETVVLRRAVPQTQAIDYIANDPFPAESHEEGLDRATMTTQQIQEELDRAIKLSRTNTMTSTEFTVGSTERANKILAFDSSGEISVTQELGTYQGTDATTTTEAYVVRDIIKSTTAAQLNNVYICVADSVVGDLLTDTDHFELLVDAVSAATSATSAAASATTATTKASEAATSATNAATSETNAATSATNAETAKTAAETAQAAAETALDTFDDKFLGSKASDPTVDNDGNALTDGALYFNTTDDVMKVYDLGNTQWKQLTPTTSQQANIDTVAANDSNITTVAGNNANITTVAGISSDVTTVATNNANVTTVAGSITNVNTTASNITGVNSFAERYRVESSDPSTSLDEGDLAYNTTDNALKYYDGSSWNAITPGIANIVEDSTPQLGGNLDVQTNQIVSTSNNNVKVYPNGTGVLEVGGDGSSEVGKIQLNCEQNSHGIKLASPNHAAGQSYTITFPATAPVNGKILQTDGSGNLSFADAQTLPTITTSSLTTTPSTSTTHTIDGTGFVSVPIVEFIKSDTGAITRASAVSFTSSTRVTATVSLAAGSYFVRVENNDGGAVRTATAILTVSTGPSWTTSAGSLGTVGAGDAVSFTVAATSDSTIAYSETTSILTSNTDTPATTMNLSLNSSTGAITGTAPSATATTTYTFTLRATDDESQTADREFSITVSVGIGNSGQFN